MRPGPTTSTPTVDPRRQAGGSPLRWYADSARPRPEVGGPYPTHKQAVAAMQDSLLIDGFAEDTNRNEWLDDVYVDPDPASIARMCADYRSRVTLIDPATRAISEAPTLNPRSPLAAGGCRPAHCTSPARTRAARPLERSRSRPTAPPVHRACSRPFSTSISRRGVRSGTAAVASPGMATTCPHQRPAG